MDPLEFALMRAFERYFYCLLITEAIKGFIYYETGCVVCPLHGLERVR